MNQFGFKQKKRVFTCNFYCSRKVVDYYVNNCLIVNLCFFDMAKGYVKVNHSVLLMKLMKRNVPAALLKLLYYWYSISSNRVRWENILSQPYKQLAGIRQGGVTSQCYSQFMPMTCY